MAHEAARNLEHPSFFASTGSSMPTRQKQLELARDGHDFVLIHAPSTADEKRALQALAATPPRYAIKYKRLIDRKSVVYGKSVSVRVDLGGARIIKKKTKKTKHH